MPDKRAFPGFCGEFNEHLHVVGGKQLDLNSFNMFANSNFDSLKSRIFSIHSLAYHEIIESTLAF